MTTQWAPGPLHSKRKIRVFLLQEDLFALVVHSVGVSEYRHHTAKAQESLLNSGATNKAVSGADQMEHATPILSLCHGIFTD